MKKEFLLLAAAGLTAGMLGAQTLPTGMTALLPAGVTVNLDQNKKFYAQKNLCVAGSPEKGYYAFFQAADADHGEELWITDGTPEGTRMVKDIHPGVSTSNIQYLTRFNDKVVFGADDGEYGMELWISDGTEDGTYMLKDIHELESSNPLGFQQLDETHVIFYATNMDSENAGETAQQWLWVTDGTEDGTQLVAEVDYIFPGSEEGDNRWGANMRVGRKVFFKGEESDKTGITHGIELWVTDGTTEGTHMVKDINTEENVSKGDGSTNGSSLAHMQNFYNEKLFFKAWSIESGNEPWAYDVKTGECYEIFNTIDRVNEAGLGVGGGVTMVGEPYNGEICFRSRNDIYGDELGVTNCEKGNFRIFDVFTEEPSQDHNSYPDCGAVFDNLYIFCAADGFDAAKPDNHGGELRCYDGEKVWMQCDWAPGALCDWVKEPLVVGGSMYWWCEQGIDGTNATKTVLCRLDKWNGTPEIVTNFDPNGDLIYALRNLDGKLLFTSGVTKNLYIYSYRSDVCDLELNPDVMEPVFATREELAAIENIEAEKAGYGNVVNVMPNPVVDSFEIDVVGQVEIATLYSLSGSKVLSVDAPEANTVSVKGLAAGLYLLTVEVEGKILTGKVIVK
ncbi:MAG: T9SS type A sorting domain-containing protein [Clostridium sp.]|nr:T9SS type A sorting domain-containing protein [Clostridium sp.]